MSPDAVFLSEGNIGEFKLRDDTERYLLQYSEQNALPVLEFAGYANVRIIQVLNLKGRCHVILGIS